MKRIFSTITVETERGWPIGFTWEGRRLLVRRPLRYWVRESRWWTGRSERRIYFRLLTQDGSVVEIYRKGSQWVLTRIFD